METSRKFIIDANVLFSASISSTGVAAFFSNNFKKVLL